MFDKLCEQKQSLEKCQRAKALRERYRGKLDSHSQQRVAIGERMANLEGEIAFEESELTKILRRIQRIQSSGAACVIGGILRRDPTACVEMLVDLSGSEAVHNANISRFKSELRDKEYQMNAIENEITYDTQIIDQASDDLNRNDCFDIGVF
jgi:hypothetical protein